MTRYGNDVLLKYFLLVALLLLAALFLVQSLAVKWAVIAVVGVFTAFVVNFFRDPHRVTPEGEVLVISPADGKVVVVQTVREERFFRGDALQISIFMSPLNVHVNRIPVSGVVRHVEHVPGQFMVAFADKASEVNERVEVLIERPDGSVVLMKQIAGTIARRIVAELAPGQQVRAGERFGMIKFGSRVDLLMAPSARPSVGLNVRTVAGETVLATYAANA